MGEINNCVSIAKRWTARSVLLSGVFLVSNSFAATVFDLTTLNSMEWIGGDTALILEFDSTGAGSGAVDDFVRYSPQGNNTTAQGYNTDGSFEFNELNGHTHSIQLGDVPSISIGGVAYRQFAFDANENDDLVVLDEIEIYTANSGSLDSIAGNFGGQASKIFELDSGMDNSINLGQLDSGSGALDMVLFVKSDLFGNDDNAFVYLYSAASNLSNGFESWVISTDGGIPTPVPVPAAVWLLGSGIAGLMAWRRREKAALS